MLIHVAAGAVVDPEGRVLIAQRPPQAHQGGLWEFPGGKLERSETPEQALARELAEELGIKIAACRPLIRVEHDYADRRVLLDVYRVDAYQGMPVGREGQPLAWLEPWAMDPAQFPAADRPIITALRLPSLYLITGPDPTDPDDFLLRLGLALETGIKLVQLRAHELPDADFSRLVRGAYPLCRAVGARLLLNRDPKAVADLPCDGLHLSARRLRGLGERPDAPSRLVGASCHDAEIATRGVLKPRLCAAVTGETNREPSLGAGPRLERVCDLGGVGAAARLRTGRARTKRSGPVLRARRPRDRGDQRPMAKRRPRTSSSGFRSPELRGFLSTHLQLGWALRPPSVARRQPRNSDVLPP